MTDSMARLRPGSITQTPAKSTAQRWVDNNTERMSAFHSRIFGHAEPAWREYLSAADYVELLRGEGFEVEDGSGGMPTAFVARWGEAGPVIASYAEYDAVPGNSQETVPYRSPRPGMHPWAPGHTDPHSALGVGALAGVLAAKQAMEEHRLPGRLVFFGEPAEKVCGSKPVHAAKGYYDDMDAAVSYHPMLSNTAVWDTHCGSYWSCVFTFECFDPPWGDPALLQTPGRAHTVPRSPGALDAACLMQTITKYTKENMYPHTGTWTMNEFFMVGGMCTSDNLAPKIAQIQYAWRSPELAIQQQLYHVLADNARHAAAVSNCEVRVRWVTKTRVGLPNHVMADVAYRNLELVGPPEFGEAARRFAREIQQASGVTPMDDPFTEAAQTLTPPEAEEAEVRRSLPEWQRNFTSDDYVEYTWHAPTVRLHTAKPALREPSGWAHWANNALGGLPAAIDPTWLTAARTVANTIVDLASEPELLAAAKAEFGERTGGGVGGQHWVAPLLDRDFVPPVDLPWPEYVETARGRDWYLPLPVTFGERL
jgi:aminobenzoyl-glutamate utilization protein B